MNAEKKRRKDRKQYLKLRKHHAWVSIPVFLITAIWFTGLFLILAGIIVQFSLESRLNSAAQQTAALAGMYETGGEEALKLLDKQGITYQLTGTDGTVLRQNGEHTQAAVSGLYERRSWNILGPGLLLGTTEIRLCSDQSTDLLKPTQSGGVCFNYLTVGRSFWDALYNRTEISVQIDLSDTEEGEEQPEGAEETFLELPLWITADVQDGTEQMSIRTELSFRVSDLIMLALLLGSLALIFIVIIGFMLFDMIGGFVTQARISRIYFTNMVTKGRNRIWYLVKGEQILRSGYAGKNRFAAVDLRFVKYQSFCVCHSLAEGERLLREIHSLLQEQMQKKEVCAHTADGCFALLLHYETEEQLSKRLQGMIERLQKIETEHNLAFHAGIAPVSGTGIRASKKDVDIEQEYSNACNACTTLDSLESSGTAFFDQKLVDEQKWVDTVTECQKKALDNEEFLVYYQPKYDPQTNRLRGAEALIRWQSPDFGFVSPGRFIPIFEKNGFITEIDHYMIEHVARDQRRWLDAGYSCVPVSVNVSRAHFIENTLAEQIRDMVDEAGTPHELIEIELTESAFFDDKKAMIRTIEKLKEYGFAVSMDDFGSGYSSLNSLKDMPLEVLKLDAEFFRGEEAGTDRGEIVVSEAIRLAKSLHMRTVAEGVEIKEQVDFLASQGCDMIQGYYFAKPMPGADYEERMRAGVDTEHGLEPAEVPEGVALAVQE